MKNKEPKIIYNTTLQFYKSIPFRLIIRKDYDTKNAMRFTLNETNQNVWIPKKHLAPNGTLLPNENVDYVFRRHGHQLNIAGVTWAIAGIKRRETNE